eukprot:CAMPEP_0113592456 /NCGR_PEP_ID=MMETSP0015_2-20120614/37854_1 /TAXON_ID=2838 /ORGANISM="Odontella" /LENGTH=158 /DNA_ID=CAMNT_0000498989 /DNA_START=402 /DNA_END=881 /DNA_ORIENTATION=+ /assembly_acc=CAM_ASM_000160
MLAPLLHRPCPSSYHIYTEKGPHPVYLAQAAQAQEAPRDGAGAAAGGTFASLRVSRGGSARRTVASRRASASGQGASASPSAADAAAGGTRAPGAVTARGGGDGGRGAGGARAPGAALVEAGDLATAGGPAEWCLVTPNAAPAGAKAAMENRSRRTRQ